MRKTILIAGAAICIICAALIFGVFTQRDAIPAQNLTLSDYPKLFAKETVIVIGDNASQIEIESAEAIAANMEIMTGNKPEIINTKKIESFKYSYNLIIVGTPNSNEILGEVYNMTDAIRVTGEYPGENKGVLEILKNPWDEEKAMLLVAGSDEWGVKGGVEMLDEAKELNKSSIFTGWFISPDKYVFIDHHIHTHGELIEENYRGPMIDSPTYNFDEETRTLKGIITFDVNDTLRVVYGSGSSLTGAAGGGKDTMLYGVYELPYDHHEFRILYIDFDGTAYLLYKNVSIPLKSGEEWVNITSRTDIQQFGDQQGVANLITTDRITNYGIMNKSKIETEMTGKKWKKP